MEIASQFDQRGGGVKERELRVGGGMDAEEEAARWRGNGGDRDKGSGVEGRWLSKARERLKRTRLMQPSRDMDGRATSRRARLMRYT